MHDGPIVVGPWLAEVGYEALYWIPFLRWWKDAYRIPDERLTVVSRGGVSGWYEGIAARYVDIFDYLSPEQLAAANAERQDRDEGGGRKQSAVGMLDVQLLNRIGHTDNRAETLMHPSAMFRLFRHPWHGHLPMDLFWRRTRYRALPRPGRPSFPDLPSGYIAMKFYTGPALPDTESNRDALRALVRQAASVAPVVVLETGVSVDDHADYVFGGIPGVISARAWMTPRDNLAVQTALIAHARLFVGTCGGLAWLAPFMGVPTVGVYSSDRQLALHLLVAGQAARRVGVPELTLLDLRAVERLGLAFDRAGAAKPI